MEELRRLDRFRIWHSLDDLRRCLQCGAVFSGREIELIMEAQGTTAYAARCPTKGCVAIPLDWALVTPEHLFSSQSEER